MEKPQVTKSKLDYMNLEQLITQAIWYQWIKDQQLDIWQKILSTEVLLKNKYHKNPHKQIIKKLLQIEKRFKRFNDFVIE